VTVRTVPATVLGIPSGGSLTLRLHLGWRITFETTCQLIGVHAPEISTEEGQAAKRWLIDRLGYGGPETVTGWTVEVTLISHQIDKYGNTLGQVMVSTQQGESFDLGMEMLEAGHAVPMS
jgi:endonuclease YncB( thermonuclease family)